MTKRDTLSELRELLERADAATEPAAPELPVLLGTMEQVAQMCQVGVDRVRDWTYEPGFPVIRTAHMVRIHLGLLDEWLQKRSQERPRQEEAA